MVRDFKQKPPQAKPQQPDLLICGYERVTGELSPIYLARVYDEEEGIPIGYRLFLKSDMLSGEHKKVLARLPDSFRFKDAKQAIGCNGQSATANFLKRCIAASLLKHQGGIYTKTREDTNPAPGAGPVIEPSSTQQVATPEAPGQPLDDVDQQSNPVQDGPDDIIMFT